LFECAGAWPTGSGPAVDGGCENTVTTEAAGPLASWSITGTLTTEGEPADEVGAVPFAAASVRPDRIVNRILRYYKAPATIG